MQSIVRTRVTVAVVVFVLFNMLVATVVHASTAMRGQLNFQLKTVGEAISVSKSKVAKDYQTIEGKLSASLTDAKKSVAIVREFTKPSEVLNDLVSSRVKSIVDPKNEHGEIFSILDANPWASPLFEYVEGNESDEEPPYVRVNTDLRTGAEDSAETIEWVAKMRQALSHLPKYEGISFRGTRLTKERIEKYYPVGGVAHDAAFISSSLSPETAFKFARLWDGPADGKINVVFVIKGHTGRPVSNFARMHAHEQEILFANGTTFNVVGKSAVAHDSDLNGPTQIILLNEEFRK